MTTVFSVRKLASTTLGPQVAQVTSPEAADAVARLMGQTLLVEPVSLPRVKKSKCFLCDPEPFFELFPFSNQFATNIPKFWLTNPVVI